MSRHPVRRSVVLIALSLVATLAASANAALGAPKGGGGTDPCPGGLEPNLVPIVPHHLQVQNTGGREFLRLTNGIANVAGGPWHLHPETVTSGDTGTTTAIQDVWSTEGGVRDPASQIICSFAATQFEFHPAHNHWHIGSVAQFGMHAAVDDGTGGAIGSPVVNDLGVAQSFKTTFCLIDWVRIDDKKKTPDVTYWACDRTAPFQGVSVGWIDQYHHSLEGQEVDFTGAPPAVYYLKVHVNDEGRFVESDTTDNIAWVSLRLTRDSSGNPKFTLITNSPCSSPNMCGQELPNR